MPLQLHNTLTSRPETFVPLTPGRVLFYTCGPTVYDYAHIGNFRSFLNADLLRRWLQSPLCTRVDGSGAPANEPGAGGYDVTHVMNITDVGHMVDDAALDGGGEDKMEAARKRLLDQKKSGALPEGASADFDPANPFDIAEFYAQAFIADALLLGIKVVEEAQDRPELLPRPTRMIKPILEMVLALIDKGHAYVASDGACYFDTRSFPDYGELSGNTIESIRSGAGGRVSESSQQVKKHPADFMLWKPDPHHLMRWDPSTELGRDFPLEEGYPGWHLECSVMAQQLLGEVIDIHSGGEDNIFPHHECEIAQSRCAFGTPAFARYWFHTRFLIVEGAKMSKSKGNFFTIRDLTSRGFEPAAIRLELIKTHYRQNANFTEQGLKDSARIIQRWRRIAANCELTDGSSSLSLGERAGERGSVIDAFARAMDDDLNVAGAIGAINSWITTIDQPTPDDAALMRAFDDVLGVLSRPTVEAPESSSDEDAYIDDLVRRRSEARAGKDWGEADKIRDELSELNVEVTDTPEGPKWARKVGL